MSAAGVGQASRPARDAEPTAYRLEEQVGFLLRQAQQRHAVIFAAAFGDLTPLQWAAMAKLAEIGECSQNLLGRLVGTDVATIKGVVDRLMRRGWLDMRADSADRRRVVLRLTPEGLAAYRASEAKALDVSRDTLAPLAPEEREGFLSLLDRLR